jgi:hypothetical protein
VFAVTVRPVIVTGYEDEGRLEAIEPIVSLLQRLIGACSDPRFDVASVEDERHIFGVDALLQTIETQAVFVAVGNVADESEIKGGCRMGRRDTRKKPQHNTPGHCRIHP